MSDHIKGLFFDGGSSRRVAATLGLGEGALTVRDERGATLAGPQPLAQVEVSSRLGNMPRFLRFEGGGAFETADNDAVDALLAEVRPHHGLAHRLESRLRYALLGVVVTLLFVWGGVRFGIPALAEATAYSLPPEVSRHMGDGALALLDRGPLSPSKLADEEQARLRARFAPFIQRVDPALAISVEFRDAEDTLGPNALALPSGTIVFTDQLVQLAEDDEELIAVLAHEIGHIDRRHALRRVIQGSALGLVVMAVTGDVSSVTSAVAAVPVILTELGYSRAFEREADRYAVRMLGETGIPVSRFAAILSRLENSHRCGEGEKDGDKACAGLEEDDRWQGYLATHPATAERLKDLAP
ncbi:M48 family metallopeptidase [Azoarcus sp. TTM-91]|uniref:M48 family metallopeptidase n=1 Tax=Azoarcus sp. TTM-91 TaxID=2691581 RepID=UPI0032B80A49